MEKNDVSPEEIMVEDQTRYHYGNIPAPLLSRVKQPFEAEERKDESFSTDGIPAPLLAGGAYRVMNDGVDRVLKKSLEIREETETNRPIRLHVKKIKKRRPIFDE